MATSCFLHFQLSHFPFHSPSPSSSGRSGSCRSYVQTESKFFRGITVPMAAACSCQESSGLRFLPPLGFRSNALVVPISDKEGKVKTAMHTQKNNEIEIVQVARPLKAVQHSLSLAIAMISLTLGIILGFAFNHQERAIAYEVIIEMQKELKELVDQMKSNHGDGEQKALKNLESEIPKISDELYKAAKLLKRRANDDDDDVVQTVEELQSQVVRERRLRRTLELNMKETTEAMEIVNQKVEFLFYQLKTFRSRIVKLEGEREVIQKLVADERRALAQAQKNLEDAQNKIMKLGKEKEDLESRTNKLEEELASTSCEIVWDSDENQNIGSSEVVGDDDASSLINV